VSPGSVTYASRTHPHRFSVPGTQPVRQLSVATAEQGATFKDAWRFADDPEKLKDYLATTGTFFVEDKVRQKAAGAEPAKTGSSIVPPGAGRRFEASGAKYRMLADVPAGATRSFAIMDAVYPAGYASWPLYTSCRFDEFWYVMEGTILVDVGGEQKAVTAGTAVYSPRGTPHHFSVPASGSARLFAVVSGGQLAVIEGAGKVGKDPAKLRAYLAKSQIHPADQTGACQS
jgi:mannose-6-phosphate isomerase-like protein (cupin superfamily)